MSISSALSNALSGLRVTARGADVVSSNIANAMTEGYGPRELEIASRVGQGARVAGVTRHEDAALTGDRRLAEAETAAARARTDHLTRLEGLVGLPDQPGSLAARTAAFEGALTASAAAPQDGLRLGAAVTAAVALADTLNGVSQGIQAERSRADAEIAAGVERLNDALAELAGLNTRIRQDSAGGRDIAALLDRQAVLVDAIAPLVPVQGRRDGTGALQLYSRDGQALLDGRAATLGFAPATAMAPDLTEGGGALAGLTLNGRPLDLSGPAPALAGGQLHALFAQRDDWGPAAQAQVDAVARDLAARFGAAGPDPTLGPGQPGLFTDAGAAVDPAREVGLAGRLRVNAAVLPEAGGAGWRLRDGLGAPAEGPPGAPGLLQGQIDALAARRPTASGGFPPGGRSFAGLVADHLSLVGTARQSAEAALAHGSARHEALRQAEAAQGVDTDAEMQRLLRIEQVFAANARVIRAADEMIDQLIRMGA